MRYFIFIWFVSILSCTSFTQAQERATPIQFLDRALKASDEQCSGNSAQPDAAPDPQDAICKCVMDRARAMRNTLSLSLRNKPMTEPEFSKIFIPEVLAPCAGKSLRSTFGEQCPVQFAKAKIDTAKFCSCMASFAATLTDADAAQLITDMKTYPYRLAESMGTKKPPPEVPPMYKRYTSKLTSCSAP